MPTHRHFAFFDNGSLYYKYINNQNFITLRRSVLMRSYCVPIFIILALKLWPVSIEQNKVSRSVTSRSRSESKFHEYIPECIDAIFLSANFHHPSFQIVSCIDETKLALSNVSRSITWKSRSKSLFCKFMPQHIH